MTTTGTEKAKSFQDIDLDKLTVFIDKKTIKILVNGAPLVFQTGQCTLPFPVSKYDNKYSGLDNYIVSARASLELEEFWNKFDEKLKELIVPFSSSEYVPVMKTHSQYPSVFKMKLPRNSHGIFTIVAFDDDTKVKIDTDNVQEIFCKGRQFNACVTCDKIVDFKDRLTVSLTVSQIKYIDAPYESYEESDETTALDLNKCMIE